MRLFTKMDAYECRCTESEVGTEWQDRWGNPDLTAGNCIPLALGKRKVSQQEMLIAAIEASAPTESDVELLARVSAFDCELAKFHSDPEKYKLVNSPTLVVRLLDIEEKRRIAALEKEEALQAGGNSQATNAEMQAVAAKLFLEQYNLMTDGGQEMVDTIRRSYAHLIATFVPKARREAAEVTSTECMIYFQSVLDKGSKSLTEARSTIAALETELAFERH